MLVKSSIRLYGPSIDLGLEALYDLVKELGRGYPYGEMISHIISTIDPNLDLLTGKMISGGAFRLGEYDFIIEWKDPPGPDQVRGLIRRIDEALLYTGCRYTITTTD
ncbi:MAG: hypothetical protein NWE79_06025 [Candidatus Bathyarchaeota archaeon]|nr:hypothetical protein [Candidatus Bathyarchaeota archaeon]